MIDEPLLVICCFKVPPRRRSAVVSSVFVENWIPNSGEGEKGGKKGREESGGIRESSFIIASGRIKLDGYGKEVNLFTPLGQFHVQLAGKPFSGRVWMLQRIESQVAQGTADFEWLSKHHRPLIKPVKRSDGKERERERVESITSSVAWIRSAWWLILSLDPFPPSPSRVTFGASSGSSNARGIRIVIVCVNVNRQDNQYLPIRPKFTGLR